MAANFCSRCTTASGTETLRWLFRLDCTPAGHAGAAAGACDAGAAAAAVPASHGWHNRSAIVARRRGSFVSIL
eukprot:364277-Chlamydomonas_euryale.AAC.4